MISIKSFLDKYRDGPHPELDVADAMKQMGRLLLDGISTHLVHGRATDCSVLRRSMEGLARQLDGPRTALDILGISSDAIEALEAYSFCTTEYLRAQQQQMSSMVAMLTDTLADISGQTDASVVRLQAIEKDLESASGLSDIQAVRTNLEGCLRAVREAAAQQRCSSGTTAQRLQDELGKAQKRTSPDAVQSWDTPVESVEATYVAVFKLQRADLITTRFGESAKQKMFATLGTHLKAVAGPADRLLRWRGTSFVMFITSAATLAEIKTSLYEAVANTGMQHVEFGKRSALVAVGVDWVIFPQGDNPALDGVFAKVDAFLANPGQESVAAMSQQ
jgi:GGDEF domain-containing protein